MLNHLAIIACGICSRLDGIGDGDDFIPGLHIFKDGGINYARYMIALFAWAVTGQWIYGLTYALAISVPWGEKHWWMKFGLWSWFGIGFIYGIASLSPLFALWLASLVVILKFYEIDQAYFEVLLGMGCMLGLVIK
jgi:hypothetical protein